MPPVLEDYTYCLGESGFVLNTDFSGVLPFVDVTSITGLDTAPQRVGTTEREGSDGAYVDNTFQSMRTIVITGTVYASTFDADTLCDTLRAQYANPTVQPFYFKHPGKLIRFANAQGGGAVYNVDTNRRIGQTPIQLSLLCGDPYIYDFPANFAAATPATPSSVGFGFTPQVNFLTGDNTGFESTIGTWVNVLNSTIARSTLQAHSGTASLALTSSAAGNMSASNSSVGLIATNGAPCSAGDTVFCSAWFFAATVARNVEVGVAFYDITGTLIGSTIFSSAVSDSTSAWTQNSTTVTAPANSVWCRVVALIQSTGAAGEVHFVDDVVMYVNGAGFNIGFGTPQTPTVVQVQNFGSHTAFPIIQIFGPQSNPTISDAISNISMRLNLTLGSHDSVIIDCRNKTIIVNAFNSVRSAYSGMNFFSVPPGVSDTFFLNASAVSGSYSVTLYNTYY